MSSCTDAHYFVRFGVAYGADAAGVTQGDVQLTLAIPARGEVLGTQAHEIAWNQASVTRFEPVTRWMAALGMEAIKAAILQTSEDGSGGAGGSLETGLACQTADADPDDPNSWSSALATFREGNYKACTGMIDVTDIVDPASGTKPMWIRFGVAARLHDTATWGVAEVTVTVSAFR